MAVRFIRKELSDEAMLQVAAKMEPRLRDAFVKAVDAVKGKINMDELVRAVKTGDANRVLSVLALDKTFVEALRGVGLEAGVMSVRDAVQQTFLQGSSAAYKELPKSVSMEMSFNQLNPEALRSIDRYEFELVREVTADAKEMIRGVLDNAFREGGHPYEQAREIRESIGLTANQEKIVANYRAELEAGELRDALARELRDGRFDRSILAAIRNGKGIAKDKIDQMVARYRQNYINYRAKVIARTETIRASAGGQRELWRQAKEQGLLGENARRKWVTAADDRTCDECLELDGKTAAFDQEFAPGVMDPPDPHPNCRCVVVLDFGTIRTAA